MAHLMAMEKKLELLTTIHQENKRVRREMDEIKYHLRFGDSQSSETGGSRQRSRTPGNRDNQQISVRHRLSHGDGARNKEKRHEQGRRSPSPLDKYRDSRRRRPPFDRLTPSPASITISDSSHLEPSLFHEVGDNNQLIEVKTRGYRDLTKRHAQSHQEPLSQCSHAP